MQSLNSLPASMFERALFARKSFIENPSESQIDDELIVWCFNKEDSLWYSLAGNYSSFSPKEKRERYIQKETTAEDIYKEVMYQSRIRGHVLERDKYTCQLCQATAPTKLHIHHILKRAEGGSDHLDNLLTVCPKCHRAADTKLYNPDWVNA